MKEILNRNSEGAGQSTLRWKGTAPGTDKHPRENMGVNRRAYFRWLQTAKSPGETELGVRLPLWQMGSVNLSNGISKSHQSSSTCETHTEECLFYYQQQFCRKTPLTLVP